MDFLVETLYTRNKLDAQEPRPGCLAGMSEDHHVSIANMEEYQGLAPRRSAVNCQGLRHDSCSDECLPPKVKICFPFSVHPSWPSWMSFARLLSLMGLLKNMSNPLPKASICAASDCNAVTATILAGSMWCLLSYARMRWTAS